MIDASDVTAVVVTRGNVNLERVLAHLPFDNIAVWDNSTGEDLSVYGRYHAIEHVQTRAVLILDDDVHLPEQTIYELLMAYEPGVITANMPQRFRRKWYTDHCLVGLGAIFDRELPDVAFSRFALSSHRNGCIAWGAEGQDISVFNRTCDVVFTALTPFQLIDAPIQVLDYAYGEDRMYRQPDFMRERQEMLKLALAVRDSVPA